MNWPIEFKDIVAPFIAFLFAFLLWRIQHQKDRIRNIESQLSDRKYTVYYEVFTIFYDLLKNSKEIKKTNEKTLVERMIDLKKNMIVYAPDTVMNKFLEWTNFISDNPSNSKHLSIYLDLMIEIRKDMGHKDTKTTGQDLLRSIMSSSEEFEKIKKQIF